MQDIYQNLAKTILQTNNIQQYEEMENMLTDFMHIKNILENPNISETLVFVFSQILSKNLLNEKYNPLQPNNNLTLENVDDHGRFSKLIFIIEKAIGLYFKFQSSSHLVKSLKNLISICLKSTIDGTEGRQFFNIYIKVFFPQFTFNEKIVINQQNLQPCIIPSQNALTPNLFTNAVDIFVGLLEYVTISNYNKSYYVYRKNVYSFRCNYLPYYLQIAISYGKLILNNVAKYAQFYRPYIKFLNSVVSYPFRISTHELSHQESLTISEVFFPSVFRSLLCDYDFIKILFGSFLDLVNSTVNFDTQSICLRQYVQVIGKICSTNRFSYRRDDQIILSRQLYSQIGYVLLDNFKFFDSVYLNCIISFQKYMLSQYKVEEYKDKNYKGYIIRILKFIQNIISQTKIVIDEGSNNVITKAFEILSQQIISANLDFEQTQYNHIFDNIIFLFIDRISNPQEMHWIFVQYRWSEEEEVQKFQEFFEPIVNALYMLKGKLTYFKHINLDNLNECSLIFWMYFATSTLPNSSASQQQTQLIFKFFIKAKSIKNVSSLQFINRVIQEMLCSFEEGQPSTSLWNHMKQLLNLSYNAFLQEIIRDCFSVLESCSNENVLQGILKIFQNIYKKIKRNFVKKQQKQLFEYIKKLFIPLEQTSLNDPQLYKIRIKFQQIVGIIWINFGEYDVISELYSITVSKIKTNMNLLKFGQFLNDLTGYLNAIVSPKSFQLLVEFILADIPKIFNTFLNENCIQLAFKQPYILKSYTKFVYSLISGFQGKRIPYLPHSQIPLKIYELIYPSLLKLLEYDYDGIILQIWQQILTLNPMCQPLPLHKDMGYKNPKQYTVLLRIYSQNLIRFQSEQNLFSFYPYIKDKIDILTQWWNEVIQRDLHPPINIRDLVYSKVWVKNKEINMLGKLIYTIGRFDSKYWSIQNTIEDEFIKTFAISYQLENMPFN